ncbi:ki-ras-induced actin-interacting protein-IP3R-interacting domain olf186-M [Musca autumnalis]|uniref:ki-ras-induced actin-interacting protein-IP3R-interacting domain olf186-M n=1 Tax=Musca autumnalis TaxID=221902 RepID=UPI003CF225BE
MELTGTCSEFKENLPQNEDTKLNSNNAKHTERVKPSKYCHNMETSTTTTSVKNPTPSQATAGAVNTFTSTTTTTTTSLRKKRLQRQKSTVYSGDETEYAADLEEEEDDEEDEGYSPGASDRDLSLPIASNLSNQKKKQVRFRNKQQSESSLQIKGVAAAVQHHVPLDKTPSSSSLTSSLNSSTGTNSSVIMSHERRLKSDGSFDSISELPQCCGTPPHFQFQRHILKRDNSIHSDSSRYSSVDSLLEARKPDPEAILINLGFGPVNSDDILSRIPKRFLKPSQVRGIDTEAFIKRIQLAHTLADHSVLGYRGLTGNPDAPPSHIVAKIMERFEVNERKKSLTSMELKLR